MPSTFPSLDHLPSEMRRAELRRLAMIKHLAEKPAGTVVKKQIAQRRAEQWREKHAARIIELYLGGARQHCMAEQFGVSLNVISSICRQHITRYQWRRMLTERQLARDRLYRRDPAA